MKRKISAIFILMMSLALPAFYIIRPITQVKSQPVYYYPIADASERRTLRWFSKYIQSSDNAGLECGKSYTGYYTGDDFEVFNNEKGANIPVYAFADGKVVEEQNVNGYGGLIVLSHTINGKPYTSYYAHVNLTTAKYKLGQDVKAGSIIAYLGKGCSAQTGFERKHLHFAIHKGSNIDITEYISSMNNIINWLNPTSTLSTLKAREPQQY